jgi:chromatin remodeling complex protein RSC6
MIGRNEVTKLMHAYVVENKLKDPKNGQVIHPDSKMAALLKVDKNVELTYFNIQTYLKPHYIVAAPTTA